MPTSAGGIIKLAISAIVMVAIGIAILSRLPVVWKLINRAA